MKTSLRKVRRAWECPPIGFLDGVKDTAGTEMLMVWRQLLDDESNTEELHVAAIELEDRRYAEPTCWDNIMDNLLAYDCVLRYLPLIAPEGKRVVLHIIFAGREPS